MKAGKMDKVAAVAKMDEQQSLQEFSKSRQSHQQKLDRLEQLLQYKADYEAALGVKGSEGIAANQLQDYRLFLGKLNQAIEQQMQDLQGSEASLEQLQARWLSKSQRKEALDNLVDERHKEHSRARDKAEQKEADEGAIARNPKNNGL